MTALYFATTQSRLLACAAFVAIGAGAAHAQSENISLPEQPLSESLMDIAQQTGKNILFEPGSVVGIRAHALNGRLTAQEAAQSLVQGTGLHLHSDGMNSLVVQREEELAPQPEKNDVRVAQAEAVPAQPVEMEGGAEVEQVIVTGSRVIRDGYEAPTPVTVLGAEQLERAGTITIADTINRMPALAGSVMPTSSNNSVSQGSAGLNNLDLRGLGSSRTLVLLDGQRLVGSIFNGVYNNGGSVDINVIPSGLVQRVDVVTGGASAVYGSDAVSGVVNFVLDHDFTGLKGDIEGGISDYGDNQSYKIDVTAGFPFANGRGHFLAYGQISGNNEVRGNARPWTNAGTELVPNPAYVAGNGLPQYIVADHVGLATAAPGGVISSGPLAGIAFGAGGTPFRLNGMRSGLYLLGGDWQFTRTDNIPNLAPGLSLGNAFSRISYSLTDDIEVYGQLQWAHSRTYESAGLPSTYLNNLSVSADNPFMPASIRAAMTANNLTSLPYGLSLIGGDGIAINYNRIFMREVVGADGQFMALGSNWKWNAYYEHSSTNITNRLYNNPITANLKQAIASVEAADGSIACSNPAGGCVPFNPFGVGVNSQVALNYVTGQGYALTQLDQDAAGADISGEPFSSWAGPVSIALGMEWRRESVGGKASALDKAGAFNFGNYKPSFGAYSVVEGYVETVVPLATNLSWSKSLDLNAAVRGTSYSTSGYVTTWKVGTTYQPIDDLRIRATFSRDIRAPNLSELFTSGSYGLPTFVDNFNNFTQVVAQSESIGNPDLKPEVAETKGLGVVFQPSFFPNFQASVDYFNIAVSGAIASLSGQNYIDQCYLGNQATCPFITRNAAGTITKITIAPINIASVKENGIDIEASYILPLVDVDPEWDGELSLRFLGTRVFQFTTDQLGVITQGAGTIAAGSGGLGAPHFRYNVALTYSLERFSATVTVRGISEGVISNSYIECTSGCPLSTALNPTVSSRSVPSNTLVDLSVSYKPFEDWMTLYFVVDNITNEDPPNVAATLGVGYLFGQNNSGYDRLGRMFRMGARFKLD